MRMKWQLSLLLLACFYTATAQEVNWDSIQSDIFKKRNLVDVFNQLEAVKQTATANKDEITIARAWYHQMQIQDQRKEDTAYFSNSYFIDSILTDGNCSLLMRSMMLVIKSKRIDWFSKGLYWRGRKNLFSLPDSSVDFRKLSQKQLDSLSNHYLDNAKSISLQLNTIDPNSLLWLSTDPLLFLFKPSFTDIIYAEQLHLEAAATIEKRLYSVNLLDTKSSEFFTTNSGIPIDFQPVFNLYKQWALFHQSEPDKFLFIELLAKKFLFDHDVNKLDEKKNQLILANFFEHYSKSVYSIAKAYSVFQLAGAWYELGHNYSKSNELEVYYLRNNAVKFDTTYQLYYNKALSIISANDHLLDSFYYLKRNLLTIKESILKKDIAIKWKRVSIPNEKIPLYIKFKNIQQLYYRLIKLNSGYKDSISKRTFWDLLKLSAIRQSSITLPTTDDHQVHAVNVSVPGLPAGHYAMLYSDKENPDDSTAISGSFYFSCSNIAAISNDGHVFVLDRTTGRPIPNSTLLVEYTKHYKDSVIHNKRYQLNKNGTAWIVEPFTLSSYAFVGDDTLSVSVSDRDDDLPDDVYDKDSDDDLLSFYEGHAELHLFTDRAIYRPGQKVFFKGILMTSDPKTGEKIVVSKKNLKFPIFQKLFNSEVRAFWKDKLELTVEDPFNKTTASFNLKLNEYGSFSGSFQLKPDAPTGEWNFDTDIDIANQNDGSFKVEEYKRPTFEISIEKPTTFLQIGDSFSVNLKVKSFAGAQLNNVMIDYEVTANFNSLEIDSISGKETTVSQQHEIYDTTGYTDASGNLLIKIPANFLKSYQLSNEATDQIRYYIHVNAIDGTGESHEEELNVTLSNRPVKIDLPIQKVYEKNELKVLSVTAKNEFAGAVNKEVEATLFSLEEKPFIKKENHPTDYELVNEQWIFRPLIEKENTTTNETVLYQTKLTTNKDKLNFPAGIFNTGKYRLEIICMENGKIIGEKKASFEIFDRVANTYVKKENGFHYAQKNGAAKGDSINWLFGEDRPIFSIFHAQYYAPTKNGIRKKNVYEIKDSETGINDYSFRMPEDAFGDVELTHLYVLHDELHKEKQTIYLSKKISEEPQIIIEQYRKKLAPGAKETFTVSIKTKNENLAAELMTVMYDATLDKLEKFKWVKPNLYKRLYLNNRWDDDINNWETNTYTRYQFIHSDTNNKVQPLWWLNPLDYFYIPQRLTISDDMYELAGRVSGVSITSTNALNEVVVTGLGIAKKNLSFSVISVNIHGAASIDPNNRPLIIIDGVPFTADFNKFNTDLITDFLFLTGADATALYGSKAANGVILISTKGPLVLPKPEEPVIKIRKDFSETAFFYPQLHADAEGFFKIDFTMPESVTQWNWKLLAHTKDAKFIFAERNIITQLPLMVQPNVPRFLYQGDSIVLQSRITNLDTAALTGVLNCVVEDAVTGENISKQLIKNNSKQIQIDAHSNSNGFVNLLVPTDFLHPLKITISVSAGNISDGEEYTIPVMSKKILVSQSQSFAVDKNKISTVTTPEMPADAMPYGVSMYIKPKPQTALLNALPYLAFYQYNCAEQTFNKMLAHAMAIHLAKKDSAINMSMEAAASNKEDAAKPVADELSEETMPWMLLNNASQLQQQRLRKLMDTVAGKVLISKYLEEIAALQKPDGGISWFSGGESSDYISCYLMGGFGKLKRDSISFLFDTDSSAFSKFLPALISFVDTNFNKKDNHSFPNLFYLYCRSFWKTQFPVSPAIQYKADAVLNAYWKDVDGYDLSRQALLVITSLQFDRFKEKALKQLESIRQLAIADNSNGVRWKAYSNEDNFSNSDEETIAMLAEAFEATGYSKATVDGILQWLLTSKEQHYWTTTKATAAIVNLLQRNQQTTSGLPATVQSTINKSTLTVTDNLFGGQLFSFAETNTFPASVIVTNDNNINITGGINYYYFSAEPPANKAGSVVSITKRQYRFNKEKNTWEEINGNTILKIADKIKTVLTITALKQLKYVFIDDKKAAALEPEEGTSSGYQYGDHIRYYQSVRDAGMQFFAESIPSGVSSISYETVVATEGKFYGGTASLQCMYQPQVRTYAKGVEMRVVK